MPAWHWVVFAVAAALHGVVGFFYVASGLVAPLWALLILGAIWVGLAVLLVARRDRIWVAVAVPIIGAVAWFAVVQGLGSLLDWTA